MHFNNRGIVAAWHLQPTSDTEHRWCFKCPKEEGHAKEKNNNSRCWLICVSVAHCHPAPTYIKQAAGRWWHHSAALVWQIVACYRRTVLPLGYNSVLNVFSCQWFAVQCVKEKRNYVASLIFFFVLYFKSDDSPSNTNLFFHFVLFFKFYWATAIYRNTHEYLQGIFLQRECGDLGHIQIE